MWQATIRRSNVIILLLKQNVVVEATIPDRDVAAIVRMATIPDRDAAAAHDVGC